MAMTETQFNEALTNLEKAFTSKTVVGDAIQVEGHTIVPLVSVGMGFGAGSGSGGDVKGQGNGGGYAGGGGVKPVALIISDKDGIRVERLVGAAASTLESLAGIVTRAMDKANPQGAAKPPATV